MSSDTAKQTPAYERGQHNNSHSVLLGYLLLLFGFMGGHRFYYGKQFTGILWFFTCGLFLVGWLVDFFLIPAMDREADIKYYRGEKDYSLTWLLLVFLGAFGAHRFYLGKYLSGLVYLFTFGLFGLGWLHDLCTINRQIARINQELDQ